MNFGGRLSGWPLLPRVFLLLILIPAASPLFAQATGSAPAGFPRLEADPAARELNLLNTDGSYSWQDLTDIALWASAGSTGGRRQNSFKELIFTMAEELRSSPSLPANLRERGEYILTFMYDRFLKTYSTHQTRIDEVFNSGRYNCVSSAVLYTILASSVGMDVRGVMTRDHAFVSVNTGNELIDVETTNPFGFDPGSRREFHDAFGSVTGFAYVPARNYRDRVFISQLELASLILSNRIAELESRGRYNEAVPLAVDRAAILARRNDPVTSPFFADPEKDLLDRILNYGAALIKAGKEADALAWVDVAEKRYGGSSAVGIAGASAGNGGADPRWQEFVYTALNNLLIRLLRAQQISEARDSLTQYAPRLSVENFKQLDALVLDAELLRRISAIRGTEDAEAVLRAIDTAHSKSSLPENRVTELRTFIILKEGERLSGEQGPPTAIAYTEAAITRYGKNPRLEEALRTHRSNRVADLHNSFAALFNRRDFESARDFIKSALTEFPGNRQLTTDLNMAEQALRNQR
jgi:tetratricopeptide (TPR) repeat protein